MLLQSSKLYYAHRPKELCITFSCFHELATFLNSILDGSNIKEGLLGQLVNLTVKNHVEAFYCVFD